MDCEAEERDPSQAWFWTPEWQAGEREADADYAAGRYRTFDTWAEAEAWLLGDGEDDEAYTAGR